MVHVSKTLYVLLSIIFTCTPVLVLGSSPGMLIECLAGGGCEINIAQYQLTDMFINFEKYGQDYPIADARCHNKYYSCYKIVYAY